MHSLRVKSLKRESYMKVTESSSWLAATIVSLMTGTWKNDSDGRLTSAHFTFFLHLCVPLCSFQPSLWHSGLQKKARSLQVPRQLTSSVRNRKTCHLRDSPEHFFHMPASPHVKHRCQGPAFAVRASSSRSTPSKSPSGTSRRSCHTSPKLRVLRLLPRLGT